MSVVGSGHSHMADGVRSQGAFDEAVKDVEGVVHSASPVGIWNPKVSVEGEP